MKKEDRTVKPTLTEQIIGELFEYIQQNQLGAGDDLPTETELMTQLKVSRGALREALCHLKALGIVSSRRGSGFRVNEPDMVEALSRVIRHLVRTGSVGMRRLYDYHRVLEIGCVADAVRRITDEQLQELERARVNYEKVALAEVLDKCAINVAEMEFHQAMMASSGSRTLTAMNSVLHEYFKTGNVNQDPEAYDKEALLKTVEEHNMIVDAYKIRSQETAYFTLRFHLRWGEPNNPDFKAGPEAS